MSELKKLLYLTLVLVVILLGVILHSKFGFVSFKNDDCTLIPYKNGKQICLGQDAGMKANFETASAYCEKMNMRLPTREEAWYIWVASENCQRAFASGGTVSKNISYFIYYPDEKVQAISVKNYCNEMSSIKFSQALQYNKGYFWLNDSAGGKLHYSVNYASGSVEIYKDKTPSLGVRCVK